MSKVRVYEIAKQLNMDQKSIVALFQSIGVGDVRNHMSAVEVDQVDRLKRHLERQKSPEVVEERIRPGVVKRRARAGEAEALSTSSPQAAASQPGSMSVPNGPPPGMSAPPSVAGQQLPTSARTPNIPQSRASQTAAPSQVGVPSALPSAARASGAGDAAVSVRGTDEARGEAVDAEVKPGAPSSRARTEAVPPSRRSEVKSSAARSRAAAKSGAGTPRTNVGNLDFDGEAGEAATATAEPHPAGTNGASAQEGVPFARASHARAAENADASAASPATEGPKSGAGRAAPEPDAELPPPTQVSRGAAGAQAGQAQAGQAQEARPQEAQPPPSAPPQAPPPQAAPASTALPPATTTESPKRPSTPPRTGIDVWQGRPGVPMPQAPRTSAPPARRTTYDPRAAATPARPGGPMSGFPNRGGPNRPGQRPGFGPQFRPRPGMQHGGGAKRPLVLTEMAAHKKVIKIEESVTLQKLASLMSLKVTDVLIKLLSMGMSGVNINSTIDGDTAKILANEFGWTVEDVAVSEEQSLEAAMGPADKDEKIDNEAIARPPIVTVMGHVDHGKTSLLDKIRKATVAAGEAGGITQHIGAYRVETSRGTVAFLDTPGHEAFTSMRARGAQVTDIVVLVVAADDGVMPQTREAISHAKSAKVPIIVAVNKIDKPTADPERVKRELSNLGLNPEEWGGDTLFCHVSALTGEGIDALLDAIILQSEVLELRASPKRRAQGVVVEALLDRGRGPVARVMVQDGTLRTGDILIAGPAWGKVRAMTDELGRSLQSAGPATPVEVLGLNEVPSAGDPVHSVKDAKTAEEIADSRRKKANKSLIPQDSRVSLEALKE